MAKREEQKIVTKKHMARQEREEMQTRYLRYGAAAIIAVVLILVGIALVDAYILTPNKSVAVVNGEKITAWQRGDNKLNWKHFSITAAGGVFNFKGNRDFFPILKKECSKLCCTAQFFVCRKN